VARLQIGSAKAWGVFACFVLVMLGTLMAHQTAIIDRAWLLLCLGFLMFSMVVVFMRMRRMKGRRAAYWRSTHIWTTDLVPAKWRRWMLDE
jgi:hypothetical protein